MPQPQYQSTTLASATSQLASNNRLSDPDNLHWSLTELQNAIIESLRIFQALTGFYRERETLRTVADQVFYDLRTSLDTPANSTYPYSFSITDGQVLSEIQAHLLEPISNPWTGTPQFSISSIASALQRVRDQFLSDTGSYVTRTTLPSSGGRIQLPQTLLDIRRAAWKDFSSGKTFRLSRMDEYAALGYSTGWKQNPRLPDGYSIALTPPISVQLIPEPSDLGTLDICVLSSGPNLVCDPNTPTVLGLLDDYCWGIKYGVLSDLLSGDGPGFDPDRAAYCRQMYNLSTSIAKKPVSVLQASILDVPVQIGSIDEYDGYSINWQNRSSSTPTDILAVSPNLLAVTPPANSVLALTLDMARSMIVPSVPSDFLQVSQEFIESVLDMAQHILSFKLGGSEFGATTVLRDNFLRMAALQNSRLRANIFFNQLLIQPASKQDLEAPRLVEVFNEAN